MMFGLTFVSSQYHTSHCKLVVMTVVVVIVVVMTVDAMYILLFT